MRFGRTLVSFIGLTVILLSGEVWLKNGLAFNIGRIVFTSTRDGNTEIYVMDADGKNPIRLTDGLWETAPDWSLDGQKIAFTSRDAQANPHITVMDADGHDVFKLTDGDEASWSPDGTRVAFEFIDEDEHAGHIQIYVINVNGRGFERMTPDLPIKKEPAWSPNGRKIAYASQEEGYFKINVMDADGKNRKRLTRKQAHNQADNRHPTWSPDGRTIAYEIWIYDDENRIKRTIHLMTAEGQYLKQLSEDHDGHDYHPDFGPVGLAVTPTSNKITIWGRLKKLAPDHR